MKAILIVLSLILILGLGVFLFTRTHDTSEDRATEMQQDARTEATEIRTQETLAIEETPTPPTIVAQDQPLQEHTVIISSVDTTTPLWIVAYTDDLGKPGRMIGEVRVDAGSHTDIPLTVDETAVTDTLYLVAHKDAGADGVFEFPGPDVAFAVDGVVVVTSIAVQ